MRFPESFDGIMSNYPTANFLGLRLWGAVLAHVVCAHLLEAAEPERTPSARAA